VVKIEDNIIYLAVDVTCFVQTSTFQLFFKCS